MRFLYQYLRGVLGGVGLLTIAFLVQWAGRPFFGWNLIPEGDQTLLLYGTAVVGIVLYSTALGFSRWDMYRSGYQPVLTLLLLITVFLLWFWGYPAASVLILLGIAAHRLHLTESDNLWDYLVDPFVILYAIIWVIRNGF
jgi:hypothetical protein